MKARPVGRSRSSQPKEPAAPPRLTRRADRRGENIVVRWRRLEGESWLALRTARDVIELVSGHMQPRLDSPVALGSPTAAGQPVAQSGSPLGFVEAPDRIAGAEWTGDPHELIRLVTDAGRLVSRNRRLDGVRPLKLRPVANNNGNGPTSRRIHVRPGEGGKKPRKKNPDLDPFAGLERYGQVTRWSIAGGAWLAVIEVDPLGNTVIGARLSDEDRNENFLQQVLPNMGLAARFPEELRVRYILLAEDMPGWRHVRIDEDIPPAEDTLERDDILLLQKWAREGWLEHVVWRDPRRLARDIVPAELIGRFLEQSRIGLWFADTGRRIDLTREKLLLRTQNMVAAEDWEHTTRKLQLAKITHGPLADKGWKNPPFGFVVDEYGFPKQDPVQWQWVLRMFEIADSLASEDISSFSSRKVAIQLAEEGCTFSQSYLGKLLHKLVYATGEWSVMVRGVEVAQKPIELIDPVPLDRFLRVQDALALRRGHKHTVTRLGDFLFNYVETVHGRCADLVGAGPRPMIRGDRHHRTGALRYRHRGKVPEGCVGTGQGRNGAHVWSRDLIEPPVVEAIRELATHPQVLKAAADAARHQIASSSPRLAPEQRTELERQRAQLLREQDLAADEWVERSPERGGSPDLSGFQMIFDSYERKITAISRRLDADAKAAASTLAVDPRSVSPDRVTAFLEIMSLEVPEDAFLRHLRARLFQRIVHRVVIADEGDEIVITLEGHLVPESADIEAANPVLASADLLDGYVRHKAGEQPKAESELARADALVDTASSVSTEETLSTYYSELPSMLGAKRRLALERRRLDHIGWWRMAHRQPGGVASWRRIVRVERAAQ